jgi:putative addiction module antidote
MLGLKLRKIGNSLGVILPREALNRLHLKDGDKVYLVEAPDGSYRITPYDPEFEKQMQLAEKGLVQYRNTLRALGK